MKKSINLFLIILFPVLTFSQGIRNDGATIIVASNSYIVVDGGSNGNYINNDDGKIDIDGTIIIEGDFTNNAANNVFINTNDENGKVIFAGTTQSIISDEADLSNYIDFENVTINSGSSTTLSVVADNASAMTVNGILDVVGTFTLASPDNENISSSLITGTDVGDITGTGTININRFFKVSGRWQYISAPMANQSSNIFTENSGSGNFNPNLYDYNEAYNETTNPTDIVYANYDTPGNGYSFYLAWNQYQNDENDDKSLKVGNGEKTGYITYNENNLNLEPTFSSVPSDLNHNTSYSPLTSWNNNDGQQGTPSLYYYDGWNLIGNPYPCALDWAAIHSGTTNINGCVYMWDGDNGNYVYYGGGTSYLFDDAPPQTLNSDANAQYIPAMQSFFVKATASPTFTIPANARVHNNNQMYKNTNNKTPSFDYIKLQVDVNGQKDQALIRFFEEATEEVDNSFDALKMYSTTDGLPQIYSLVNTTGIDIPVAINSLPFNEYIEYKQVPLGIVVKQNGYYTFSAAEINTNYFNKLYFIDANNGNTIYTDLTLTPSYTIYLEAGEEIRDKFSILATNSTIDINDVLNNTTTVNIYSYNKIVYLTIPNIDATNGTVYIYDAVGRIIFTDKVNSSVNEYQLNVATGTYVVKYINQNEIFIEKIVIK